MKIINLSGVIGWDITARDIQRQLGFANGEDVRVEISSPGGFVYEGIEIFNRLRAYRGNVTTHILSEAASMASYIALAGDRVTAEPNAVYMIHNVWGIGIGDHRALRETADVFDGLTGLLSKEYARKTGKSVEEIRTMMDNDTYLFGEEIAEAGFVEIVPSGKAPEARTRETALAVVKTAVKECYAKMKENEEAIKDFERAAAMVAGPPVEPKKQGVEKMDKDKLAREFPDVYKAIREEGVTAERDRAAGHIEMAKTSGAVDFAHECIMNGKTLNEQAVMAKYLGAAMNKKAVDDRQADDPPAGANGGDLPVDDKTLLDMVMARSSKTGKAVAPEVGV